MSHFSINLKGENYYIPFTRKPTVQTEIKDLDVKINDLKNKIKELETAKKIKTVELLDDRQLIIYKNQYPKSLSSEELKNNKLYAKRVELVKKYDNVHGFYLQPDVL